MTEGEANKKEIIMSIVGVLILIVAVIGVTYAAFIFTGIGQQSNTISTGTISFNYTEDSNGIIITNARPMSDDSGKVLQASDTDNGIIQGYFDFTVSSTVTGNEIINYEVSGKYDDTIDNLLDSQYVKVYLTNGSTIESALAGYTETVPTYASLPTSTYDNSAKVLYTGSFNGTDSQKFRLRLWVSSEYTENSVSKKFSMRVNVNASA